MLPVNVRNTHSFGWVKIRPFKEHFYPVLVGKKVGGREAEGWRGGADAAVTAHWSWQRPSPASGGR